MNTESLDYQRTNQRSLHRRNDPYKTGQRFKTVPERVLIEPPTVQNQKYNLDDSDILSTDRHDG